MKVAGDTGLLLVLPYSPEIEPQENGWQYLRRTELSDRVFDTNDMIVDVSGPAWNSRSTSPRTL